MPMCLFNNMANCTVLPQKYNNSITIHSYTWLALTKQHLLSFVILPQKIITVFSIRKLLVLRSDTYVDMVV